MKYRPFSTVRTGDVFSMESRLNSNRLCGLCNAGKSHKREQYKRTERGSIKEKNVLRQSHGSPQHYQDKLLPRFVFENIALTPNLVLGATMQEGGLFVDVRIFAYARPVIYKLNGEVGSRRVFVSKRIVVKHNFCLTV